MKAFRIIIIIISFVFYFTIYSIAQKSHLPSYEISTVSSAEGISSQEITKLFQDQQGYIWLGTASGISRYDGYGFENFMYANKGPIENIYDIIEDDEGIIWAAGINGLFYFTGTEFLSTTINEKVINSLEIDRFGNLLLGGIGFLPFSINSEDLKNLRKGVPVLHKPLLEESFWKEELSNQRIWKITEDDEGNIWMGLDNILGRIVNDTLLSVWTSDVGNVKVSDINAINPDSVYWGSETLGLRKKTGEVIELFMDVYTYISSRTDTSLIFLTTKDLIKISNDKRDTLSDLEDYDHLYFRAMLEDKEGNIWIATEGSLLKVTPNYFQTWTVKESDLLYSNHSITQLESGEILIGSSKENILERTENFFRVRNKIPAAYNSVTEGIVKDRNGNFWYATSMSGLILYKDGKYIHIDESSGLLDKTVMFVKEDQFGRLWSGGEGGVSQVELINDKVQIKNYYSRQNTDESELFINVICDSKDVCYAVSNKAIYRIVNNELRQVEVILGIEQPIISSVIKSNEGALLVSTIGQGIFNIKLNLDGKFEIVKKWNKEDGLLSNVLLTLHLDKKNRIWTFSQNGICVIPTDTNHGEIICYDQQDGWAPLATTHIDLLESTDEMMWIVANSAITNFPIYEMPVNKIVPKTFIKEVKLFEGREEIDRYLVEKNGNKKSDFRLALPHDKNFIEFNFISTSYMHNGKNQFSYQLEGLDESWSKPSLSTQVSYPGLKPGKYNFKVLAINNSGIRGEIPASYPFKIFKPWYFRWWAILIYIFLFSSIIYTFLKLQLNKKRKENEALKLKELNEFQSHFYTNITHEFRTPLTVILGMSEKLSGKEEIVQNLETKNNLAMIERNAGSLMKLVNEMLDMSRLESGSMSLNLIQADISAYIKYILDSLKSLASIKDVALICYNEEQKLMMDFDEEKIEAIMSNLVTNAIKFSDSGDQIIVHLKSEKINDKKFLKIKVKDEGIGIEEKDLPHIFDRFYTVTDDNNLAGVGSGVGLALSKELVNLMSGKINVKSIKGSGTEFIVILPITNDAPISSKEIERKKDQSTIVSSTSESNLISKKATEHQEIALIIEDNADVASYLMICLESKYVTIHAKDGEEGIKMAIEHQPDIIISDVMMPKKNGFEVCEYLKNNSATDHIPIILLTARVEMNDRLKGFTHGADAYLTKPFSKLELFTRIDQLILSRKKILEKLNNSGIEAFMRKKLADPNALFIQKAVKVIQENIDNTILGPALLAKKLHLSESQVYRKLKSITGNSTALFIRSIRLQRAKELLHNGDLNISQVAYEVGFSNPSWFSTAFKEEFGYAPSEI